MNCKIIKERVTMTMLLDSYGIFPQRARNYRCAFHSPDKNPSANLTKGDRFHCFVCNRSWDIIDFVKEYEKCDTGTALKIINSKFNLGLDAPLTLQEKLRLAQYKKEQELLRKKKEAWDKFEKDTRDKILEKLNLYKQIEKDTHLTRGEYRNGTWENADIHFLALREIRWLNWLYDTICGFVHPECEWDYIYGCDKWTVLTAIKNKEIEIV